MGNHAHQTHCSHQQFFTLNKLESPDRTIQRMCHGLLERQELRTRTLCSADILHEVPVDGPRDILILLEQLHTGDPDRLTLKATVTCPLCDQAFDHPTMLTRHLGTVHARSHRHPNVFRPDRDAAAGLPRCGHCQAEFQSRAKLQQHVEQGMCPVFHCVYRPPAQEFSPKSLQQRLRMTVFDRRWLCMAC